MSRPEPSRVPSAVRIRRYNVKNQPDTASSSTKPDQAPVKLTIPPRLSSRQNPQEHSDASRDNDAGQQQQSQPRTKPRRGAVENLVYNDKRERQQAQRDGRRRRYGPNAMLENYRFGESSTGPGMGQFQRATDARAPAMPALEEVVSPSSPGSSRPRRVPLSQQQGEATAASKYAQTAQQPNLAPGDGQRTPYEQPYDYTGGHVIHVPFGSHDQFPTADQDPYDEEHHADEVADYLDVVDTEVGTLSYLSNIQNSIFAPPIPRLYDRRPSHSIPALRPRSNTATSRKGSYRQHRGSRASVHSKEDEQRHDTQAAVGGDVELGQLGTTYPQGPQPTRIPSRGVLSRMSSRVSTAITGRKKPDEEEEKEYDQHIREWRYMDDEERNELDEHVKLVLKKGSKFRRGLKGFYAFVRTPMGFIMTLYGFLITFWGTAIMLFIFGWIHVGDRRRYWIEICDQILCALFAAVGLGFAPFRAVDTYRMIHIARLHHKTWERRKKLGLSDLRDPNDLPRPEQGGKNQVKRTSSSEESRLRNPFKKALLPSHKSGDIANNKRHYWSRNGSSPGNEGLLAGTESESSAERAFKRTFSPPVKTSELVVPDNATISSAVPGKPQENMKRHESIQSELVKEREDIVVLTPEEQELLEHHQRKFHSSHTFYRFHETATHRAFPLEMMIAIVCILDGHSMLQAALGGSTWGIKYTHRPTALTATLISCSLSCNAVAGLLIYIGGRKTKKTEEVERRLQIALEQMAMDKIERRRARGELPDRSHDHGTKVHYRSSDGLRMGLHDIEETQSPAHEDDDSNDTGERRHPSSHESSASDNRDRRSFDEQSEDEAHEFSDAVDAAATYSDRQQYQQTHPTAF